jgi:signal transduction histidine kinase
MSEKLIGDLTTRVKQTITMVDNLLLWSKRQADVVQYEPQPLKIPAIRKIISDYAELMLNAKAITFRLEGEEEGIVAADKDMLEAILRNLLSNAFKFTPVNGEVVVQIAKEKQGYRFSIRDNGMGMSAEQVQKLSSGSSFTRLGTALEKGHGIGMQLVRDFIERHGAKLEIVSEEAQGTTFSFVLKEVSTNLQ